MLKFVQFYPEFFLKSLDRKKFVKKTHTHSSIKGLKGIPAYYYHSVTTELETVAEKMISVSKENGEQV